MLRSSDSKRGVLLRLTNRIPAKPPMAMSGRIRGPAASRIRRIFSGVKISIPLSGTRKDSLSSAAFFRSG